MPTQVLQDCKRSSQIQKEDDFVSDVYSYKTFTEMRRILALLVFD